MKFIKKPEIERCPKCPGSMQIVAKDFEYTNGKTIEHPISICDKCGEVKRI